MPSLIQNGAKEESKMNKKMSEEKVVGGNWLILLGIVGILGLILIAFGVFTIFEISTILGFILIAIGVLTYVVFVLIEKKLKLL
jgi:uncharacterized membrane protein HdeD (DUF308 family)